LDRPKLSDTAAGTEKPLIGTLTAFDGKPADLPGAWPRFRGDQFDAIGKPGVPLARQWPEKGLPKLWSLELGEGYAGAAVLNGRVYVLDYDRKAVGDALRCFSLADGKEIWRFSYPVMIKRNHGMSRTVPAVTEKYVVAFGPKCDVSCVDAVTGEKHWLIDLKKDFGATEPTWYAGQCPLIDHDRAILAPGGESLLIALDCKTGEVVWKSPNPDKWIMTHSSIMPMEFAGKRMYVYCGKGGVAGISADDGSILWDTTAWKIAIATSPSPVILPEGRIFLCGGYGSGSVMLQLQEEGGKITAKTLFRLKPSVFGSEQQTPVFFDGHLYGVRMNDKQLVCMDLNGKVVWSSGSQHRFGSGPYMIADGMIYVLDDFGKLTLAVASPKGYEPLAVMQAIADGSDSWGPMAMAAGRLILRDMTHMICLDISEKQQ
jgi:outer membrane protein assembly factor BamB